MRANLAIVLNGHHGVKQAIFFDQAAVNDALGRILRRGVLERVLLLCLHFFGSCCFLSISFILNFYVDVGTVTLEGSNQAIILVLMQRVHVTELAEHEVIRRSEVECLRGKLILFRIRNSHGDIEVGAESTDTTPKEQLLEICVTAIIQ